MFTKKTIASQCLGEFCLFFKVIPFCLSAPFAATLIHSFVNKKNFQPRSFSLNNILLFSSFCGFMSTRILPYFALSVLRSSSVTDVASQLFSIILWLRPWTPCIFWMRIIWTDHPAHLDFRHLSHLDFTLIISIITSGRGFSETSIRLNNSKITRKTNFASSKVVHEVPADLKRGIVPFCKLFRMLG